MNDLKIPKIPGLGESSTGQSFPMVIIVAGVLSILSSAMLSMMIYSNKAMVRVDCMNKKTEIASIALEHAMYKLQDDNNWSMLPLQSGGKYDRYLHEFKTDAGSYAMHIAMGNLFMTNLADPSSRQAQSEYRTIGIKVKTTRTACTGNYYAVIQKKSLGGPLVSAGKIDLPCTDAYVDNSYFFWGDIYSSNTNTGYCRIPLVRVARGITGMREQWLPKVHSKSDIYTAVGYTSGRAGGYYFASTYDDMSPTAHAHPYSQYAIFPDIDLEYYKKRAKELNAYYGPANIPGVGANKYFINDGLHDNYTGGGVVNDVTNANSVTIMAKLRSPSAVLFIDTTDGLPLRRSPCNSYTGTLTATASSTIKFYVNNTNQYLTNGLAFIQGPLQIIGDNPSAIANTGGYAWTHGFATGSNADDISNVDPPDNFYFPQGNDGYHYSLTNRVIGNVKHSGILYTGGELKIGGPRSGSGLIFNSNVCIYGSIFIGELGSLTLDTVNDNPTLFVYYNRGLNLFGIQGQSVDVVSFNEITFIMPTPGPYPY